MSQQPQPQPQPQMKMEDINKDIPRPFIWDESFIIGDPVIDAQHRKIFALITAFELNPNQTTYNDVLNEFNLHFAFEDRDLHLTVGPDKSAEHIKSHIKSLEMFKSKQPGESTVDAIKRWLVYHIKTEDMTFMKSISTKPEHEHHLLDMDQAPFSQLEEEDDDDGNGKHKAEPWYKDPNELKLIVMIFLTFSFMCAEMGVGFYANSLALISDAFHMIADGISYVIAFIAILWSKKAKGKSYTYGWERSEIIGAFINGLLLLSISLFITLESIQRFVELPQVTNPLLVVYVACGGVVLNLIGMGLFGEINFCVCCEDEPVDDNPDLQQSPSPEKVSNDNLRAVFIHIIGDLVGQICAIASGLLIHFLTQPWRFYFDPTLSLIIVFLLTRHSVPIVRRSMQIFMQRTPKFLKMELLSAEISKVRDIISFHELHVWSLSGETTVASLHLTLLRGTNFPKILFRMKEIFHSFGVHSITVQPEFVSSGTLTSKHPECQLNCDKRQCTLRPCCPPQISPPIDISVINQHTTSRREGEGGGREESSSSDDEDNKEVQRSHKSGKEKEREDTKDNKEAQRSHKSGKEKEREDGEKSTSKSHKSSGKEKEKDEVEVEVEQKVQRSSSSKSHKSSVSHSGKDKRNEEEEDDEEDSNPTTVSTHSADMV